MTAIVGYNANPSLVEVVACFLYLTLALVSYFRPIKLIKISKESEAQLSQYEA